MKFFSQYPKSILYIISNEAAERFSYYGMKAVLPLFLVSYMFNPTADPSLDIVAEAQATEIIAYFVAVAYFMPFLGALAADWFWGKYRVILYVSLLYTVGHFILSISENWYEGFMFGLLIIAIGAGGIKSNVSANVGDQFDASNKHLLSKAYGWFYFSINMGSAVSTILIPLIYEFYGPSWAFGIPGVFMALATIVFYMGRKKYVRVKPKGPSKNNFLYINLFSLYQRINALLTALFSKKVWVAENQKATEIIKSKFSTSGLEGTKAVWKVLAVFAFIPIFWALWDQSQSKWIFQAENMDRTISLFFFEFEILSAQLVTLNPVLIMVYIIILNPLIPYFEKKTGIKATPLRRIGFGLLITAVSYAFVAIPQISIDAGGTPTIWWQVLAFFILTLGEVLVSVTGLEYAYTQSPKNMKSTMAALWLFMVSLGNLLVAFINSFIVSGDLVFEAEANYYWLFGALMLVTFVIFLFVSVRIKEKSYIA